MPLDKSLNAPSALKNLYKENSKMKNILNKKLNKKGFTLAELLIVVAIIAILVAIALPLFFGALDNARAQRDAANVRSVKAVALKEILTHWNGDYENEWATEKDANCWKVTATVGADGSITIADGAIKPENQSTIPDDVCTAKDDGTFEIVTYLTETEVQGS